MFSSSFKNLDEITNNNQTPNSLSSIYNGSLPFISLPNDNNTANFPHAFNVNNPL
jgi:hypothetical protein